MKNLLTLPLLMLASNVAAEINVVEPDLKLGHWIVTVDNSAILEQALAGVPKGEAGDKARVAMKNFMPASTEIDQCLAESFFEDAKKKMASGEDGDCELEVLKSTSRTMVVAAQCSGAVSTSTTRFLNSKLYESTVVSTQNTDGGEQEITIKSVANWHSDECPAELASSGVGDDETLASKTINQQAQRQKDRVESRAKRAENRAVDKGVDKAIDKIFGKLFN